MKQARVNKSDDALREFAIILSRSETGQEAHEIMLAILTPRERKAIALRWRLVKLLALGMTQRAISRKLGISLCKITRGARELKYGPPGFRSAIARACRHAIEARPRISPR
mgnify:CR=1 FL=1